MTANKRALVEEVLADDNPDAIYFDGLDDAIVGMARQHSKPTLVVYDHQRLVDHFINNEGMSEEDALEWVGYNIECLWAGEGTPLIIYGMNDLLFED